MIDKSRLGTRYQCFRCATKFYDLNRPVPTCPECGADQREAPVRDIKALLGKGRRGVVDEEEESEENVEEEGDYEEEEEEEEEEGLGLLEGEEEDE
jgi:uncharacterized protein (TIGR02300 family)